MLVSHLSSPESLALRSERVPGQIPFALLLLAVAVWTGAYTVGLLTSDRELRIALESVT